MQVSNSYNTGTIMSAKYAGGIVGILSLSSTVQQCYNKGTVIGTGNTSSGGIVAWIGSGELTVEQCYNKGEVEGGSFVGAIIGENTGTGATFEHLYYLNTVGLGVAIGSETADDENNHIMPITQDIKTYKQFLKWIQTKIQDAD